ncbi:tetratricopeptide repeat protein [uncultured Sphaerochaeta sp.]|uniref:tetratricopeptide repeat protein n=1 Tax=uncultured Sphaerochaeta sp. TaxID=886478 RepID=UPI002AA7BEE9|nr:tetratricopeptide repeat protein [uncultured Sphaerochaeta sp.]
MDPIKWYYQRRMLNAMVQNKWEEAESFTHKLINHEGPSMGLHYNLALIALGSGDKEKAYDVLVKAVLRYGESLRLCRLLGDIAYLSGKGEDAIHWYASALDDDPSEKEECLMRLRLDLLSSEKNYTKALDACALLPEAEKRMVSDPEDARSLYERIVKEDPSQAEAWNNLGCLALDHFNDKRSAIEFFTRTLELVDHQGAAKNLARARKA